MDAYGVILLLTPSAGVRPRPTVWPPQLMPVANRPLLQHAVCALSDAGAAEIVVVTDPWSGSRVREALAETRLDGVEVSYIEAAQHCGELGALHAARRMTNGAPLIVHRGDALVGDLLSSELPRFLEGPADAAVLYLEPGTSNGEELRTEPKVSRRKAEPLGIELLSPGMIDALCAVDDEEGGEQELAGPLVAAARRGLLVEDRVVAHGWRLRTSGESILDGNRLALDELSADWHPDSLLRTRVEGRVVVHPSSHIEDALLRGPCVIGPGVSIRHAYIGPYTSVGPGCVIENAELEHSLIMSDAVIRDLGWRLEHSVVGARVRLTRDFRVPRAVHLFIGDDACISVS